MEPISQFFDRLPPRCCSQCGEPLEEQADCYGTRCTTCEGTVYYPLRAAPYSGGSQDRDAPDGKK